MIRDLFIDRLSAVVAVHADRPAVVVDGDTALTYRELWEQSARIANEISERGLRCESLVGICLPKSAETIAVMVGVWRSGAAWMLIEPCLPIERIRFLIADSGCQMVVADAKFGKEFDNLEVRDMNRQLSSGASFSDLDLCNDVLGLNDLAYVIYTSGSTGEPKGVEVTHRGLVSVLDQQIAALQLGPHSRSLFLLSTSFDASISDIGTALLSGASLWIENALFAKGRLVATAEEILAVISKRQISYVDIPPAVLARIDADSCPECLRAVLVGGEVCSPEVIRNWANKLRLLNVYGPTEATICSSFSICDSTTWSRPLIGRPLDGIEYMISGDGESGELLIGGVGLARGYRNRPELTAKQFVTINGKTMYRSGDLVRKDADGEYVFQGRIDRQFQMRGHRIEPGEIESVLIQHPKVNRAFVLLDANQKLVCYFDSNDAEANVVQGSLLKELREWLAENLPAYCVPQQFRLVKELPLTISGKVDMAKLSLLGSSGIVEQALEENLSSNESLLHSIFQSVLGHGDFSVDEHFFSIGGDSLGVMEVCAMSQIEGLDVTPQLLVLGGSIREICRRYSSPHSDPKRFEFMTTEAILADVATIVDAEPIPPQRAGQIRACSRPTDGQTVLLTGATGFLGSRILARFLDSESTKITCLVRGNDSHHARQRLEQRLIENRMQLQPDRLETIEVIAGDLSQPRFGMNLAGYNDLAQEIERVIHLAAEVSTSASYESLRPANVVGTNNIADFVVTGRSKLLDYISTLSVFVGTDRYRGMMLESDQLGETKRVYGGYAQTKWAAEKLLRMRADVVARFYRMGLLTADSKTWAVPEMDLLTLTIQSLVDLDVVPECEIELKVDVTPVDYAADVLCHLFAQQTDTSTFHIAHPAGLSAQSLFRNLRHVCPSVKVVPVSEFEQRVRDSRLEWRTSAAFLALGRALQSEMLPQNEPRPTDLFQATGTTFDMTNTNNCCRGAGLKAPGLTDEFVQAMIRQVIGATSRESVRT